MNMQRISLDVLAEKYAKGEETTIDEVLLRVAKALAQCEDDSGRWEEAFLAALRAGFIPAGRILSAAGTDIQATLINCFVQPVGDAMRGEPGDPGIMDALAEAAETMRRGGGVGYDFSAIRPRGAAVKGTRSRASGPVSYMRVFDRMCETVESAGSRRGAQMGVLRCDHPDIEEFIQAKDRAGELANFNISVAVSDAFMAAVRAAEHWPLVHIAEPTDEQKGAGAYRRDDGLWCYREIGARALWDHIMRSTYDHAEPGVLFLDRANAENNLAYCERLCGDQPLRRGVAPRLRVLLPGQHRPDPLRARPLHRARGIRRRGLRRDRHGGGAHARQCAGGDLLAAPRAGRGGLRQAAHRPRVPRARRCPGHAGAALRR